MVALLGLAHCAGTSQQNDAQASDAAQDSAVPADTKSDSTPDALGDGAGEDAQKDHSAPDVAPSDLPQADGDSDVAAGFDYRAPWIPPTLSWSTCPDLQPPQTLAQKAAYYDWIAPRLHQLHAALPGEDAYSLVYNARCDAPVPETIVPDADLPTCSHDLAENTGLWTSLYLASQAFRYGATQSPEALEQIRITLRGMYYMMKITGKDGLYTRDFRDPTLPGMHCPSDPAEYAPPSDKMVGNRWVKVDTDGCFITWDPDANAGAGDWKKDLEHCTDTKFAGFCWQRNASKDEYSGHVFALGIVAKLVDDAEIRTLANDALGQIGHHLLKYNYWINDYDGRNTRYGSAHAMSMDEFPGYNAWLALSWTLVASTVTGDEDLSAAYHDCLLQESGVNPCIKQGSETPRDYRLYLNTMALSLGCDTNYDNVSMGFLSYLNLMWMDDDASNRSLFRTEFEKQTRGPDKDGRRIWAQKDPFFNFLLVAMMGPDAGNTEEMMQLVEDGVCTLKEFPTSNVRHGRDNSAVPMWCHSERHGPLAAEPLPIQNRCSSVFEWWGDPNEIDNCAENLLEADPPAGYLLPYWMGRYFGFISADL